MPTSTTGLVGPGNTAAQGIFGAFNPQVGAAGQALGQTAGGEFLNVAQNPQVQALLNALRSQATQAFTQDTLPAILAAAEQTGNFNSGGRLTATNRAAQDFTRSLAEAQAAPLLNLYNQERGRQLQAAFGIPGVISPLASAYSRTKTSGNPLGAVAGLLGGIGQFAGGLGQAFNPAPGSTGGTT